MIEPGFYIAPAEKHPFPEERDVEISGALGIVYEYQNESMHSLVSDNTKSPTGVQLRVFAVAMSESST